MAMPYPYVIACNNYTALLKWQYENGFIEATKSSVQSLISTIVKDSYNDKAVLVVVFLIISQ